MKVTVLGSAAAEGIPALFCSCDLCKTARERGGKEIRRRSAYLAGDRVMVDFGPDAFNSMISFGLDYSGLAHLLVSHSHQDHWYPEDLYFRRPGFSVIPEGSHLTIHGNEAVGRRFGDDARYEELCSMSLRQVAAFEEVDLGDGVVGVPVPANHAGQEEALNWLVRSPGGAILFGNDTGLYPEETWSYLAGAALDVAILDSTSGRIPSRDGHMGVEVVVEARDRLVQSGALAAGARVIANHFSHNGGMLHTDLEDFYRPQGIEPAYDGMAIEV